MTTSNEIGIVDYGVGNLASVFGAISRLGFTPVIIKDPKEIEQVEKLILPGVGSFSSAMKTLENEGWVTELERFVDQDRCLLGICLGMQLLASYGYEGGKTAGLNFIKGEVKLLDEKSCLKLPHVGWNEVRFSNQQNNSLLKDIRESSDFYFVHSFHFLPDDPDQVLGYTNYGQNFVSIVNQNNVFGVQFHPEKSSKSGLQLIKNFICL